MFNFAPTTAQFSTRISTAGLVWAMDTINITSSLGTTDNMWMGYCNNGGSPIRVKVVGTSTVQDVAIVRITAKTTTAGAYAWVDDLNGGTNPISALDIWFQGQPLAFQLSPATLGDPAANAAAVWSFLDTQRRQ